MPVGAAPLKAFWSLPSWWRGGDTFASRSAALREQISTSSYSAPGLWLAIALLSAAFLIRLPNFGNPAYEIDEEFYLLVGDRMLHGMLPYVDIWDRKPIGLFLIYAAIRLLGGDGILQYQIVATLFAAATAWFIARLASPVAGRGGGIVAALAYLLWIETVEGGGGQAPIFYNLFVAGAAAATFRALAGSDRPAFRKPAIAAMILGGIAIQIKYTALFEVAYFGALLGWRTLRNGERVVAATETAGLALIALAPTMLVLGFYTAIGQAHAFWFANFQSIFHRSVGDQAQLRSGLVEMVKHITPLASCAIAAFWQLRNTPNAEVRPWLLRMSGWVAAAFIGYFSVGALFCHYMLPLFVPLSIMAAPIFRRWPLGFALASLVLWIPFSNLKYPDFTATRDGRSSIAAMERLIPPSVRQGCMQMFGGPPILYLRTQACFVSPYVFPDHLVSRVEVHAIGVDSRTEIRRILARRPQVLVFHDADPKLDQANFDLLKAFRTKLYRRAGSVFLEGRRVDVWVLNTASARANLRIASSL